MQLSTLLPILALLATQAVSANPHRRHAAKAVDHARAVERLATAIDSREAHRRAASIAAGHPRALETKPKRKVVRKRGSTCRAKATAATTASVTEAAATTTSSYEAAAAATTSSTALEAAENYSNPSQVSQTQTQDSNQNQNNNQNNYQTQTSEAAESQASATSTSAAAAASTSAATSTSNNGNYTPNGIKAGIAGGDAYDAVEAHIGWWYDWSANPSGHSGTPIAVPMLWGDGDVDAADASRLAVFKAITTAPQYIMGFEEPDCSTYGSSNIAVGAAAALWNALIGKWKAQGSTLLSPSMCHQAADQYTGYLSSFQSQITVPWDITNIHINKNSMEGVNADIDYYYNTFGKPIWVTEFACVDDSTGFVPCDNQDAINSFIKEIVPLFENDTRVHAYAYSNGEGLGDVWPMWSNGALSESGSTYLEAIKQYH
ncbi:uncharacterized protein I206_107871 [Kwoniella pini CBS 10737]|uniref:Asl1-like glycosyl hydrolase catalytic domain-containing protein n=1 Tax=Kwoniella pini CBS 10737 TaxID=1296096 RepID=A0A1B9HYJ5_9TREE|nr:uncharacterized protein I206_06202 [Kwoniella pini CBS 10737]OCF48334.1 hypothetical protein I206_06202 [Kwoniella pini CBS 10737]